MTQHVMIVGKDHVEPYMAHVWRDDQVLMWTLKNPGLCWPDASVEQQPIRFNPADPEKGTSDWPGTVPAPIGDPPAPGTADTRNYVAFCGLIMAGNDEQKYSYKIMVQDRITLELFQVQVRHVDDPDGWYDPDVGNEPEP